MELSASRKNVDPELALLIHSRQFAGTDLGPMAGCVTDAFPSCLQYLQEKALKWTMFASPSPLNLQS
jgi:hypothetical protein